MAYFGKLFKTVWALTGDTAVIPDAAQVDGSVSFAEGFGNDYELNPATDPQAKDIPRDSTNGLYQYLTQALQWYQQNSAAQWIDNATNGGSAFSYAKGITVFYPPDGKYYESIVAANTTTPGTDPTKWREAGAPSIQNQLGNYATDTGAVNAYAIAPLPAVGANNGGTPMRWIPAHTNTNAAVPTLAVGTAAAKQIIHADGSAIQPGEIVATGMVETVYNATLDKHIMLSFTPSVITGNSAAGTINWPGTKFKLKWVTINVSQPGVASDLFAGGYAATDAYVWDVPFDVGCIWSVASYPLVANGNCTLGLANNNNTSGGTLYTTSGQDLRAIPGVVVLGFGI